MELSPVLQDRNGARAGITRILVVDDDEDTCEATALLLQSKGHETQTVYNGQDAIDEVASFGPDLVLLDVAMPDMDGLEVARIIRQGRFTREPVIAAVSGYGAHFHKRLCAQAGFDHYLLKPVESATFDQLLWLTQERVALVKTSVAIERERRDAFYEFARSQLEFGGLVLDFAASHTDWASKERCCDNVQRLQERMATRLASGACMPPDQHSALQALLLVLQMRLTTMRAALKPPGAD